MIVSSIRNVVVATTGSGMLRNGTLGMGHWSSVGLMMGQRALRTRELNPSGRIEVDLMASSIG